MMICCAGPRTDTDLLAARLTTSKDVYADAFEGGKLSVDRLLDVAHTLQPYYNTPSYLALVDDKRRFLLPSSLRHISMLNTK